MVNWGSLPSWEISGHPSLKSRGQELCCSSSSRMSPHIAVFIFPSILGGAWKQTRLLLNTGVIYFIALRILRILVYSHDCFRPPIEQGQSKALTCNATYIETFVGVFETDQILLPRGKNKGHMSKFISTQVYYLLYIIYLINNQKTNKTILLLCYLWMVTLGRLLVVLSENTC